MIIFGLILTTFKSVIIFEGSWGSIENLLKSKTEPPSGKFSLPESMKHSVHRHAAENRLFLSSIIQIFQID
jgi:hypothetical protein